jgi:hypothetical protein
MARRRPVREFFSFDSFLDVVANVVGIIIRLILVAWVGARTYKTVVPAVELPPPPVLGETAPLSEPTDPRVPLLALRRQEITQLAHRAEQEQAKAREVAGQRPALRAELDNLVARRAVVEKETGKESADSKEKGETARALTLSTEDLLKRSKELLAQIEALRQAPVQRKELRYRTPVSRPLQTDEVMFECRGGRVTLIDTGALLERIKKVLREKGEQLRDRWEVSDATEPVGAFRLRYVVERERSALDGPGGGPTEGTYRYGLSAWVVEPIMAERGEPAEQALTPGSVFRRVIEGLDAQQTAVTLWVYPDSWEAYRKVRDYLHDLDVTVAGRPLPEGVPIASSRKGSVSRGQ